MDRLGGHGTNEKSFQSQGMEFHFPQHLYGIRCWLLTKEMIRTTGPGTHFKLALTSDRLQNSLLHTSKVYLSPQKWLWQFFEIPILLHSSEENDDMSVLVAVIHFRVEFGFYSTPVELNDDMSALVDVVHFRVGCPLPPSLRHDCDCRWLRKWSACMKMQTSHSLLYHGTEQEVRFTVCNISLVTVLVMFYLRLDSNQRV